MEIDEDASLTSMSKTLPTYRSQGENVGLLYFDKRAVRLLFREVGALLQGGGQQMWVTRLSKSSQITLQCAPSTSPTSHGSKSTFPTILSTPGRTSGPGSAAAHVPSATHSHRLINLRSYGTC